MGAARTGSAGRRIGELAATHVNTVRRDGELVGIGTEPRFAIGQRALVVPSAIGNVLWECVTLLDDATAEAVEALGGLAAIAISHPHYYSSMVEWAHRFECPVLLHRDDAEWIMRPDDAIELWEGETRELGGLTLLRLGGHFAGATVLHRARRRRDAALRRRRAGDPGPRVGLVHVLLSEPDPAAGGRGASGWRRALEPYAFERIQGAWWGTTIARDGSAIVQRSARALYPRDCGIALNASLRLSCDSTGSRTNRRVLPVPWVR